MDVKEAPDVAHDEPVITDTPVMEDVEDAPAIAVHPLAVAVRQLEILQSQVFLAGSTASIQAQSRDQGQPPAGEDAGPYCRLACDVLSCAVSACELWRESLLRHHVPTAMNPCAELSAAELVRLLIKLLASLHTLDCLKDSKQALRTALASVTAQEGDEQQLLAAVQDFFNMPTACLVLLRDMLLEDATVITRTKQALLRLIPTQLEAAECGHGAAGQEGERKRGTLKSKLGLLGVSSSQSAGDVGHGAVDSSIGARNTARIALSLLVYLYCCVDAAEQEHLAHTQSADGTTGVTPTGAKAAAAATQKLLRACVTTLRATPVVHGFGDIPVDLLRPLQGLQQLSAGAPWESNSVGSTQQLAASAEERYSLSAVSAAAAHDYGRLVEDLLALKLQYESEKHRADEEASSNSAGGDTKPAGSEAPAPVRLPSHCQVALSRAAGVIAGRAMQLLQEWQAALLQLDAFRTWQRRQRQEAAQEADGDGADANDAPQAKPPLPRCAFTTTDLPDVVRMVSYIKGLHGVVLDNMSWMEPLLRVHCIAHLGQLVSAVALPVAQGVLGMSMASTAKMAAAGTNQHDRPQLPPNAQQLSIEGHPMSAPSSARGTGTASIFASTNQAPGADAGDVPGDAAAMALTLGRMWKGKMAKHGRSHSTASSLEVVASELRQAPVVAAAPPLPPPPAGPLAAVLQAEAAANGPSQRTTEDSADTGNLIASITADGLGDWTTGRPADFRNDPYARLRDWFATGSINTSAAPGAAAATNTPLQAVPEAPVSQSERSPAAATVASFGRRGLATPSVEVGSMAAGNSPSVHRGSVNSAFAYGSSTRLPANTATDGTEDGVECTVSSVSDCDGLLAELEGEEEVGKPGEAEPKVQIIESDPEEAKEAEMPKPQSSTTPQPSPPPHWPAADLLWPPPPIPSASWLNSTAISPGNTVSAGGASVPTTRSPGSGLPRMTAPAALSTNPLYIYPSAAREAVAEQERATVAIWIASEGGAAPGSMPAHGQGTEGAVGIDRRLQLEAALQYNQQQHCSARAFCDENVSSALTDCVLPHEHHPCYSEDRPYCGDIASGAIVQQQQPGYGDANAYDDEIIVSQAQMDPTLAAQPGYGPCGSCDGGLESHQVHFDNTATDAAPAPPPPGIKKTASSPFKRIKKLFSKRDKSTSAAANAAAAIRATSFDDPAIFANMPDPMLEAFYNGGDFPVTAVGFGALPAPYLADSRDVTGLEADPNTVLEAQAASYTAYGVGRSLANFSGDFLPGLMAEATSHDGAVAVLSVGPSALGQPGQMDPSQLTVQVPAGLEAEVQAGGIRGGKVQMMSNGGVGGTLKGASAAAFFEIACRARDEHGIQRLRHFANDMQICLATAGIVPGGEGAQRPGALNTATSRRKGSGSSGARASLKRLVTTIKGKAGGGRHRAGGDAGAASDQDMPALPCDPGQGPSGGLDALATARLRNVAELMVEELEAMIARRRARGSGKSSKEGPSVMQLLALTSELRNFLTSSLPSLEPLLALRANLAAAADLSPLLVLDPSRSYGVVPGSGLGSDARGSIPWELAHKGVLVNTLGSDSAAAASAEMPLSAGLTVLTLFKDAIESIQLQQAQASATGYPEAPTASRLQLLYRRQAKWCLHAFVQMAARKVWGTYKAHAVRSRLGLTIPNGAPDVASSTAAFQGLLRPSSEDTTPQQLLLLASTRPELGLETELTITDQLAGAIDDLVRQSAARAAELLLGSDLTALVAVKQQLDVLSLAVSRLRRELPTLRPWNDAWLAALAARATSSPTCATIAEAAAATAAAVIQGCGSHASGLLTAEEIILTHACSVAALRTLSTWSYDMTAVRFKPTKHTKTIWEGLVGKAPNPESAPPPLLFPDGADIALAAAAGGPSSFSAATAGTAAGRSTDGSTSTFGRSHVQALHGLLGLDGVARWVTALRRHAVELLADAAPLLRRVHELYDSSLAGPRGPGMRDAGGASGYLQLQQRWLRDRGHSELLVSAHRAMQALGNTVAAVALIDSVLAELCVGRAPHLLPLAASSLQADQQAHAALKAAAASDPSVNPGSSLVKPAAPPTVPPPPRGAGLAGLLLGQQLPPGLMNGTQSAVQAASLVQDRLQEQLPAAFGLPGLWRSLHETLQPGQAGVGGRQEPLFSSGRLWCVVQVQLSCLSPEEQVVHTTNVGDGVYVAAAALVQLAAGAAIAPGSVLNGDTMTVLQQAVTLEQLKADLAAATAASHSSSQGAHSASTMEKATLDQLKAWSGRAEAVRLSWDRAVQLTVGAGTAARKLATAGVRSSRAEAAPVRAVDMPAVAPCSSEPWAALAQQASAAGTAMLIRAAVAAAAPPPQAHAPQGPAVIQSQAAAGGLPGPRPQNATTHSRPSSQPGMTLNHTMPNPSRNGPPRPPSGSQQASLVSANGVTGVQRLSLNGPPLPPRLAGTASARTLVAGPVEGPLLQQQQQQQQQQALQTMRAASQVLLRSPRGEGGALGSTIGLFTVAGSTAAQSRSRAASSLGDWGHME